MPRRLAPALLVTIALASMACADQFAPTVTPTFLPDPLVGGVVATFETPGGTFNVFMTDSEAIVELYRVQSGESSATIPNGLLIMGPGAGEHNLPWSWHLHRQATRMVEDAPLICNGTLSEVENDFDRWQQNVGRFCPRDAVLVDITEYR